MNNEEYINVKGGKIWYSRVGRNKTKTPLIIIHGGPGLPHNYLEPLEEIGKEREVIFYDQLGCGKSDWPSDDNLWNVDRFADELEQIIKQLSLDKYYILGQSRGTAIASLFALRQPLGLKGMILSNSYLSTPIWMDDAKRLISKLPTKSQKAILDFKKDEHYKQEEFKTAIKEYYDHFIQRFEPTPQSLKDSWAGMNHAIYNLMWGAQEFSLTGNLKNFDLTARLRGVSVPILLICGRYDESTPEANAIFQNLFKNARLKIFENSAHFPFYNETSYFMDLVTAFLKETDNL